jgi:hypothetical protein
MDRRDGATIEPLEPVIDDLLHRSGSASYQPNHIESMSMHEFLNLSRTLAPIKSDGIDDKEEWNLFEQYLRVTLDEPGSLDEPHSLSSMLQMWEFDKVSCHDRSYWRSLNHCVEVHRLHPRRKAH